MTTTPHMLELNPAAYEREAQRLRHMAHRAARCRDHDYLRSLERLADRLAAKGA